METRDLPKNQFFVFLLFFLHEGPWPVGGRFGFTILIHQLMRKTRLRSCQWGKFAAFSFFKVLNRAEDKADNRKLEREQLSCSVLLFCLCYETCLYWRCLQPFADLWVRVGVYIAYMLHKYFQTPFRCPHIFNPQKNIS